MDYKSSGVDVEAGDALVEWLKQDSARTPHREHVLEGIGGFAALFKLGHFAKMEDPCLVSCTDGVGTKVKLAAHYNQYRGVAQDMVAMCVNDMICCGATPLFFLDYYATGKLDLVAAKEFLSGVRSACAESLCALIGGETAEMPGVYQPPDFDCAGFSVGIVDRKKIIGPHLVKSGSRLLGLASSGFHSNGFSLLRKVFADDLDQWKDILLKPTALYVQVALEALKTGGVQAIAHITGGGMDNVPRVLPSNTIAKLKPWEWPSHFREVQKRTGMTEQKMLETLNCGIGLVMVVEPSKWDDVVSVVEKSGHKTFDLGVVEAIHSPTEIKEPTWEMTR